MDTFDQFRKNWSETTEHSPHNLLDKAAIHDIIKQRARSEKDIAMKYFWASFTFQIIVYALFSHVIVKYGGDVVVLRVCLLGILLFIPFTVMLLKKFKQMAVWKFNGERSNTVKDYISYHYTHLRSFYTFKLRYELILIPASCAILVWVFFRLYIAGGLLAYPVAATVFFLVALGACVVAIRAENKRNFMMPLRQFEILLEEFRDAEDQGVKKE
jgi:hypothetical protein